MGKPVETITVSKAKNDFSHVCNLVYFGQVDHYVVTRQGKNAVAIVNMDRLRKLQEFEASQEKAK